MTEESQRQFGQIRRSLNVALLAICLLEPLTLVARGNPITPQHPNARNDGVVLLFSSLPGGMVRDETLSFTVFNPSEIRIEVRVKLYDEHGNVIAESSENEIRPDEFHSFAFNRNDILLAGEPGTGRLQVRATLAFRVFNVRNLPTAVPISTEHINNLTGGTTSRWEPKANLKVMYDDGHQ